jgi:hypothetical protein
LFSLGFLYCKITCPLLLVPATSFAKTPLQPILPLLEAMPSDLHVTVPYLLSFVMGILF